MGAGADYRHAAGDVMGSPIFPPPKTSLESAAMSLSRFSLLTTTMSGLLAGALLVAPPLYAQASPQPLDFAAARRLMQQNAPKLAASEAALESRRLQTQALRNLGAPSVHLSLQAGRYHLHSQLDTSSLQHGIADGLGGSLPMFQPMVPRLPGELEVEREKNFHGRSLGAVWPLYTGGLLQAAKALSAAKRDEAQADVRQTVAELDSLLVQRYFGAQLARQAAALRAEALRTIAEHDHAAQRMMEEGMIARVQRLQAQVALESARREALKAQSDAELAEIALQRLLQQTQPLQLATPLFVDTRPLPPLAEFQALAAAHHPGLEKVNALAAQAEQLREVSASRLKPTLALYGSRQLQSGSHANWVLGLQASWTLFSPIDRRQMLAANQQRLLQADYSRVEAQENIALLVEKNWRSVEDARQQYLASLPAVTLAEEVARLHRAGLREGTSTASELMDAQTQLAKVRTESARAAHDYVLALATLLESAGVSEQFSHYAQRADVRIAP
ncbi:transporter [Lysobacteraceae bacterium NML03-0222]|nr:transporter [Xanthomonadaceae bacterium NML03-0222]